MRAAAFLLVLLLLPGVPRAEARVLDVGPGRPFSLPSAAAAAQPGDVIRIAPGTYEDCAVLRADRVVIEGEDFARVTISNRICNGKGVFVITGNDVTVRGITLAGTRSANGNGNGAGIRAEGVNLTVERVRFLNNENGILHAGARRGALIVRDSVFIGNGTASRIVPMASMLGRWSCYAWNAPVSLPRGRAIT
jgi:nitrous oxidase accessory protein NosD